MKKTILLVFVMVLAQVAKADFTFGTPVPVPNVNTEYDDCGPYISADDLSLYLCEHEDPRPEGYGNGDIWVATRATKDDDWSNPVNLGPPVNTSAEESGPSISTDGLTLYFADGFTLYHPRSGGHGKGDLWVTTRASVNDAWEPPVNLGPPVNTAYGENLPRISANGLSLYFDRTITQPNSDLYVTKRATTQDDWGTPTPLLNVNTNDSEHAMSISSDERVLLFQRGFTNINIWIATRTSTDEPFGPPSMIPEPVSLPSSLDCTPNLSPDGTTLYFISYRPGGPGGLDIWQAPIEPVVDLNGDGIVDAVDMCIIMDYWGTDEPSSDIGPMPWGDGIVDVQDLIVLSEHLFEEVNDPTLIVHWALDETEGMIVADSAGDNDGYALGDPIWKPDGGQVNGALQLDGVDDYVLTGFVMNPEEGPFSVLSWIKGGAPGQTVLSQMGGASWLCADASDGNLMTELKGPGGDPLLSSTVITDGEWHRIGFIWDGSNRTLYVDAVIVAEDTQNGLADSNNGLYIGCGKAMESGSFFSGLIDDVRIYNRVVSP